MEMSDHPKGCEHLLRTVSILQQLQKALGGLKGLHAFRAECCLRIGKIFVGRLRWPKLRSLKRQLVDNVVIHLVIANAFESRCASGQHYSCYSMQEQTSVQPRKDRSRPHTWK